MPSGRVAGSLCRSPVEDIVPTVSFVIRGQTRVEQCLCTKAEWPALTWMPGRHILSWLLTHFPAPGGRNPAVEMHSSRDNEVLIKQFWEMTLPSPKRMKNSWEAGGM